MLQIELKVNGCLIDYVDVHNVSSKQEPATYEITYRGKRFGFTHNRSEGAIVCAKKALQAIENETPSQLEHELVSEIIEEGKEDD